VNLDKALKVAEQVLGHGSRTISIVDAKEAAAARGNRVRRVFARLVRGEIVNLDEALKVAEQACRVTEFELRPSPLHAEACRIHLNAAAALAKLRALIALYDHFGYEADWDIDHHSNGWYCMGSHCGQPLGSPHLDNCQFGAILADPPSGGGT
jgi:hypothetical protein